MSIVLAIVLLGFIGMLAAGVSVAMGVFATETNEIKGHALLTIVAVASFSLIAWLASQSSNYTEDPVYIEHVVRTSVNGRQYIKNSKGERINVNESFGRSFEAGDPIFEKYQKPEPWGPFHRSESSRLFTANPQHFGSEIWEGETEEEKIRSMRLRKARLELLDAIRNHNEGE